MDSVDNQVNPLPYVITFVFLVIIFLFVISWAIFLWKNERECLFRPDFWCADDWTCNKECPDSKQVNECFKDIKPTGLASCLYGVDSKLASICQATPGPDGVTCSCPSGIIDTSNCFSGCAQDIGDLSTATSCCCNPGTSGCPWETKEQLPVQCRSKN